jgi:hypothetical protein
VSLDVDLRLIVQGQGAGIQRHAQIILHAPPLADLRIHVGVEKQRRTRAAGLGAI